MDFARLEHTLQAHGQPAFRARQIWEWVAKGARSYEEMTSTFPWHQSVTAFCQWTTFRGS